MAIDFDKIKDDLFSMGKEVGDRVSDVSNIAKLKIELRSKEDDLQKQFAELGRMYYDAHKEDTASVAEQDMFSAIEDTLEQIEETKRSILNLQGTICCPECGGKYQKGYKFCPFCGGELHNEPEADEDIFVDEEEPETAEESGVAMETAEAAVETTEAAVEEGTKAAEEPEASKETDLDALDGTAES